jgi:hypothetical protein
MSEEKVKVKKGVEKGSVYWSLQSINIKNQLKKKNGFDYLPWSVAWKEVKKLYPEAAFYVHENGARDQMPIFGNETIGYSVKVSTTIEGNTETARLSVTNGANKPLKDSGYSYQVWDKKKQEYVKKQVDSIGIDDIENTVQRALVKSLAYQGLGLSVWVGDGIPEVYLESLSSKEEKEISEQIQVIDCKDELRDHLKELKEEFYVTADMVKVYEIRAQEIDEMNGE